MELTGLTLSQLAALFGVSALAVTALYLLKLRRRTVVVPFVALWERLLADSQSTSLFARLKHWLSLLLAVLLVGLLSLALADPRHAESSGALRHRVVLIDTGITMQTREGTGDRLSVALQHVRHLIGTMGTTDRMLIAQVDHEVTPLSPMTGETDLLTAALANVSATDARTDLQTGIDLAHDILKGRSNPELILVTDGAGHADRPLDFDSTVPVRQIRVGAKARNAGLTAFAVRRFPLDKTRAELLLTVHNSGDRAESVELQLKGDGQPIDVRRIELAAGEHKQLTYDDITGVDRVLEARLQLADGSHDSLEADDHAYATLPERKRMRVLCVTEGNRYLEAALLLDEYLQVDVVAPSAYVDATDHDVVIFDRHVPPVAATRPAIYLWPMPELGRAGPFEVSGSIERPFFDRVLRDHPLTRHISLRDVNMASALAVKLLPSDQAVGADRRGPLIVTGSRNGVAFVALTFDVTQSDLPLRVAWPMLLLNALDYFSTQRATYVDNHRAGERSAIHIDDASGVPELRAPDGSARPLAVEAGTAVIDEDHAGVYALRTGATERPVAVNPAVAPELRPVSIATTVETGAPKHASPTRLQQQPWAYLLAGALLLLAIEWLTFHRRWTL